MTCQNSQIPSGSQIPLLITVKLAYFWDIFGGHWARISMRPGNSLCKQLYNECMNKIAVLLAKKMAEQAERTSEIACRCSSGPLIVSAKGSHKVIAAKASK